MIPLVGEIEFKKCQEYHLCMPWFPHVHQATANFSYLNPVKGRGNKLRELVSDQMVGQQSGQPRQPFAE